MVEGWEEAGEVGLGRAGFPVTAVQEALSWSASAWNWVTVSVSFPYPLVFISSPRRVRIDFRMRASLTWSMKTSRTSSARPPAGLAWIRGSGAAPPSRGLDQDQG